MYNVNLLPLTKKAIAKEKRYQKTATVEVLAPNPVLSNMAVPVITSPGSCGLPETSGIRYQADYTDPDGDIDSDIPVQVYLQWSNGGTQTYISEPIYNTITGNGYSGSVSAHNCLAFGGASYVDVTLTIWDASGNVSNSVTRRAENPGGIP